MPRNGDLARWRPLPVLATLALAGCGHGAQPTEIAMNGYVDATEIRVASKVAGRVQAVERDEGDRGDSPAALRGHPARGVPQGIRDTGAVAGGFIPGCVRGSRAFADFFTIP